MPRLFRFLRYLLGHRTPPAPAPAATCAAPVEKTQRIIGYRFNDPGLCAHALVHRSHRDCIRPQHHTRSNERLEFLGDAVLDCCVAHYLFTTYPRKNEGALSKIKSLVVSRKILAQIARELDLGPCIRMGSSEHDSGGRKKVSILANTFEAILGAMYLDGGIAPVEDFLQRVLYPHIERFLQESENINYKSKLMERSQKCGFGVPVYQLTAQKGPEHNKMFYISVWINDQKVGEGKGHNKKMAQQQAAKQALHNAKQLFSSHKA
jgi:ribonuclease-3